MPQRLLLIPTLLVVTALSARAEETPEKKPTLLFVDAAQSTATYTVENALKTVVATSKEVEGTLALLADGRLQVMVRAPVKSFDSKNSNRDVHMLEAMDATTHPYVVFKGVAANFEPPTRFPTTLTLELAGELDFHGRKLPETVPVQLTFASADELRALARFDVSLTRYDVPLPSLMFVKLRDRCTVSIDLLLKGK